MRTYNIHFIRHGETEEVKKGAYIGRTDVSLSNDGINKLKKLDEECKYPYAPVIFSSPLKRCTETCKILYEDVNPIIINELAECNFGQWEGKTAEDLKDNKNFEKWLAGDVHTKPPEGESSAEFTTRICNAFEKIVNGLLKSGTRDCAIVTHGGVIMTLLAFYGLPQGKPFEWAMENGCGFSMRISMMLWQREKICEVYQRIPIISEEENQDF